MKIKEIRELSKEDLNSQLEELKKDLGLAVTLLGIALMYASNYSILNIKN